MITTVVVGLLVIAWVVVATLVALVVARMIRLRDRQRPHRATPDARAKGGSGDTERFIKPPRSGFPGRR